MRLGDLILEQSYQRAKKTLQMNHALSDIKRDKITKELELEYEKRKDSATPFNFCQFTVEKVFEYE